jgi:hypothetical protein
VCAELQKQATLQIYYQMYILDSRNIINVHKGMSVRTQVICEQIIKFGTVRLINGMLNSGRM